MTRTWIISVLISISCTCFLDGQSLIGLTKDEVQERIKKENRDFRNDRSVVKQQFNYLKYVNNDRTRTWVIYFSDKNICTGTKLICDYSEYDSVVKQLNETRKQVGEDKWEYTDNQGTYELILSKQEWYFILREKKRKTSDESFR